MSYLPLIIVLALAITDWVAADKKIKALEYFAKPATMLALLVWVWAQAGWGGPMLWFSIGAVFCLAGDIFLMLPWNLFIFGLLSFLLGHIFYIVALNNAAPYLNALGIVMLVVLGIYIGWLYPKLARGLKAKRQDMLRIPVMVYTVVISLMVYSAILTWTRLGWTTTAALLASSGAVLFYASDSMLAWDRFVNPLSHARLRVMVTYHLGQIGILLGGMLFALTK
jgi:uncharacterized membrane protein YhhN